MFKFTKKTLVSLCMALALMVTAAVPAFAAEATPDVATEPAVSTAKLTVSHEDMVLEDVAEKDAQTRGTLSGYGSTTAPKSGSGSFTVNVNGSWSAWAGCTLKTSGFSSNATIKITVKYGDSEKCSKILGPENEVTNIPIWGVTAGGYTIEYEVQNSTTNGTIQVWIY